MKTLLAALAPALAVLLLHSPGAAADCPSGEGVAASLEETFRKKVQVMRVRPSAVKGLCEVIVSLQGKMSVIHTDASGRHFVTGQVIDSQTRQDLGRNALAEYNRFTPEEMKQLEGLTALTYGESGPVLYFVTDPD